MQNEFTFHTQMNEHICILPLINIAITLPLRLRRCSLKKCFGFKRYSIMSSGWSSSTCIQDVRVAVVKSVTGKSEIPSSRTNNPFQCRFLSFILENNALLQPKLSWITNLHFSLDFIMISISLWIFSYNKCICNPASYNNIMGGKRILWEHLHS
jgi:hypothetical protein